MHGERSGGAYPIGVYPMVFPMHWGDPGRHEAVSLPEGLAEVEGIGEPLVQDKVLEPR